MESESSLKTKTKKELTVLQKRAHEIMGTNFFGIGEAIRYFGVNPLCEELDALADVPFTQTSLAECQESHILVAVFPLSMVGISERVESTLFKGHNASWCTMGVPWVFTLDRGGVSWHLVRKTPAVDSISKSWDERWILPAAINEYTPSARIMTYTIIGHFLSTGERLFEGVYVQCPDLGSECDHICIGCFDADGLGITELYSGYHDAKTGVASARKPD